MYRRRRASFSRSFSRRRRGVRYVTEPKRWEAANFFFSENLTATAAARDILVIDLMSVAHFDAFGTQPRQLTDAMRTVEIGGIVWDNVLTNLVAGQSTATAHLTFHEVLCTDRIDANGNPVSLATCDWTLTQSPVSGSDTGATDADFPVRIHRRRMFATTIPTAVTNVTAARHPVFSNTWGTNKVRLKGSLGDRQGLFLYLQLSNFTTQAGTMSLDSWIGGTLYYRARF